MKSIGIIAIGFAISLNPTLAFAAEPGTHPGDYPGPAWSPYLVGALIGVLSMLTFYFSDKPLGASTAYARLAGMIGRAVAPRHTEGLKFYRDNKPAVDWEVMLVLGAILGAFLAAWLGNELTGEWLPPMWAARFGEGSLALRGSVSRSSAESSWPSGRGSQAVAPAGTVSAARCSSRSAPGSPSSAFSSAELRQPC